MLFLILLFVVAPLVELAVIVQVAVNIGTLNTIALLVLVSIVGAWLAKREGGAVLQRIQQSLDRGELPSKEVADGGLILLAGALMIAPGFISDCLALVLLVPPTRALVRGPLVRALMRRGRMVTSSTWTTRRGGTSTTTVWDAESWEDPPPAATSGELGGDRPLPPTTPPSAPPSPSSTAWPARCRPWSGASWPRTRG